MTDSYSNDEYPLGDNSDETVVIFGDKFLSQSLTKSNKRSFLKKLANISEASSPPSSKRYKKIQSVTVYRRNGSFRAFCSVAEKCPTYNIIFVHKVTEDHDYNVGHLNPSAKEVTRKFNSCSDVIEVEEELNEFTYRTSSELRDMY